jgi:hypothetical protein
VSNLFGAAKPDGQSSKAVSEPERVVRGKAAGPGAKEKSAKGKEKEKPTPASAPRNRGLFGTWRSSKGQVNAARHSVEALGNSRSGAVNLDSPGGGVVLESGSGAVTRVGAGNSGIGRGRGLSKEQRAKSLSSPHVAIATGAIGGGGIVIAQGPEPNFDFDDEFLYSDGEGERERGAGMIVVPRGLHNGESSSLRSEAASAHPVPTLVDHLLTLDDLGRPK